MDSLINEINLIRKSETKKIIDQRLLEFREFQVKPNKEWFSELCFCLLTANSKAHTAINIQKELGAEGFLGCVGEDIRQCIIRNKHRFHNKKTRYILKARQHLNIKEKIQFLVKTGRREDQIEAREWLVGNIKGFGYKEASHFMRNVGYFELSILDRHILNLLGYYGIIPYTSNFLTPKRYKEIESIFSGIAKKQGMSLAKLDLYMWYLKTGEVLK